ncbi:hypothetical protein PR048_025097 [Dryococelus australis]|uniref:Uncharacterized protein n=1 Tax=Dryococelus australis TaxID=614101 RepID=A0ABQ9GQH6_9NEOP|nr:hypothetical protein PR048_025097 [Dryococelus australis]
MWNSLLVTDQLRLLQTTDRRLIPRLRSSDDLEKLSSVLRKARFTNRLHEDIPDNPVLCTHGTHRCHHAAHAYTGVPCAAYNEKAGKTITAPLANPRLKPGSIPSQFPDSPSYLTAPSTSTRESPNKKRARLEMESVEHPIAGKWEIPEKIRRPATSSGTIPTCKNLGAPRAPLGLGGSRPASASQNLLSTPTTNVVLHCSPGCIWKGGGGVALCVSNLYSLVSRSRGDVDKILAPHSCRYTPSYLKFDVCGPMVAATLPPLSNAAVPAAAMGVICWSHPRKILKHRYWPRSSYTGTKHSSSVVLVMLCWSHSVAAGSSHSEAAIPGGLLSAPEVWIGPAVPSLGQIN